VSWHETNDAVLGEQTPARYLKAGRWPAASGSHFNRREIMTDGDEPKSNLTEQEEAIAYRVISLFLEQRQHKGEGGAKRARTADNVAAQISREFNVKMNRQAVYRQLSVAMEHGFIRPIPPLSRTLTEKVAQRFNLSANSIHVVHAMAAKGEDADRSWVGEQVARHGAERALALVNEVWKNREQAKTEVSIGVGPGRATLEWARHFSRLVRSEADLPAIRLIAITAGGDPQHSEFDPTSFFSLFPRSRVKCIGLYASTVVRQDEMDRYLTLKPGYPGVKEALRYCMGLPPTEDVDAPAESAENLKEEKQVDIVISSMGDPNDEHDLLTRYLKNARGTIPPDAAGNVQFRYYNQHAPIRERPNDLRAFTLFELDEFRRIATSRTGHVVLMARTCGLCGTSRAAALRPLLTSAELKLWTEIVMDVRTADDLIRGPSN
jgi:hypothetical protein